jgi:hypothetical protein
MRRRVYPYVWNLPSIQLGEERLEPIGVLVVDRDRSIWCSRHDILVGKTKGSVTKPTQTLPGHKSGLQG